MLTQLLYQPCCHWLLTYSSVMLFPVPMRLFQFHSLSLNLFYHFAAPQLHTGLILLTFHCCDIGLDWHPVKKLYVGSCCLYTIRLLWTHLFPKTVYIFLSFLPFTSNFPGFFFFFCFCFPSHATFISHCCNPLQLFLKASSFFCLGMISRVALKLPLLQQPLPSHPSLSSALLQMPTWSFFSLK